MRRLRLRVSCRHIAFYTYDRPRERSNGHDESSRATTATHTEARFPLPELTARVNGPS